MRLRYGMVGGGGGFIGDIHRKSILLDDSAQLVAGCFSRNPAKNHTTAKVWNLNDASRVYADYEEMAKGEAKREEGIDFVVIVTPNNSHYPIAKCFLEHGIHVVCDKPLAVTVEEGEELEQLAREKDLLFAITYVYANYPMVRQVRKMIEDGLLGKIHTIIAEYPEEWVASSLVKNEFAHGSWRFNPEVAGDGGSIADIGTHLEYLLSAMTGLKMERLLACFQHSAGISLNTGAYILAEYEQDIKAMLWVSQVAIGNECGISAQIIGTEGAVSWTHADPTRLKFTQVNGPVQYLSCERDYLYPEVRTMARVSAGHPEGFFEAFANIYREFCRHLNDRRMEQEEGVYHYPTAADGVDSLKFVRACTKSSESGSTWVQV